MLMGEVLVSGRVSDQLIEQTPNVCLTSMTNSNRPRQGSKQWKLKKNNQKFRGKGNGNELRGLQGSLNDQPKQCTIIVTRETPQNYHAFASKRSGHLE